MNKFTGKTKNKLKYIVIELNNFLFSYQNLSNLYLKIFILLSIYFIFIFIFSG